LSDPDQTHVEEALRKLDFLVVQDIFPTETADFADVVLPAACFAEKDGTFTNTERRVQLLRKAVEAPGEAREDWWTWCELAHRMGHAGKEWRCTTQAEIMDEIALLTPSYGGISHRRLDKEGGLAWPVPDAEHPGTPILHTERFARGKGRFFGVEYKAPAEEPDAEYPLTLTTGRMLEHYHTGTMTRRVEGINELVPTGFVEISPADAERLGVVDGSPVAVETRRGRIETSAWVTDRVGEGVVFIPFHFWEGPANRLTNPERDPQAKIPELKVCACTVSPVA
ncbi:MAG: formate dehydrogenase subunit alpha, partial [Armatimonadetes bacterium]|nr:formate dehydrogenase subunit alpha [Armatimonadota bacterium]